MLICPTFLRTSTVSRIRLNSKNKLDKPLHRTARSASRYNISQAPRSAPDVAAERAMADGQPVPVEAAPACLALRVAVVGAREIVARRAARPAPAGARRSSLRECAVRSRCRCGSGGPSPGADVAEGIAGKALPPAARRGAHVVHGAVAARSQWLRCGMRAARMPRAGGGGRQPTRTRPQSRSASRNGCKQTNNTRSPAAVTSRARHAPGRALVRGGTAVWGGRAFMPQRRPSEMSPRGYGTVG